MYCHCSDNYASVDKVISWHWHYIRKVSCDKIGDMIFLAGVIKARLIELITFESNNRINDGFENYAYYILRLADLFMNLSVALKLAREI
jgi:hypothetical protein